MAATKSRGRLLGTTPILSDAVAESLSGLLVARLKASVALAVSAKIKAFIKSPTATTSLLESAAVRSRIPRVAVVKCLDNTPKRSRIELIEVLNLM